MSGQDQKKPKRVRPARLIRLVLLEIVILLVLFGSYRLYIIMKADNEQGGKEQNQTEEEPEEDAEETPDPEKLTPEEEAALEEQERLQKEIKERQDLIELADSIALGYDYEGAIKRIEEYKGSEGDYKVYPALMEAISRLEEEQKALVQLGGSYRSVTEINHIFFHSLIADNAKAFDKDRDAKGYNMYMATTSEFDKIIQKMYEDGYVLVNISDLTKKVTLEDGSTEYQEGDIFLREGKKPFVISVDDVSYYPYMDGDGFASRIVLDEAGNPTCEMLLEDGTAVTGPFDVVPILDAFVKEHPDFSYQGAKGLLAITGYEGILGYRTNNESSATYKEDVEAAKKVAEALKADGWEFGSHSWGHKNLQEIDLDFLKRDTKRWLKEVAPLIGGSDVLVFPFGVDFETTLGTYSSDKYHFLKESGFNVFLGVYSKPWMHIKKDYVRMTRRPIDGQAMLEFPERLVDLFSPDDILDPDRPSRNW
ncbi:MAG: hypothetical protein K0R34_1543 [Herbinix sp.]|jgi:hypothetical protein|nr:hypothetical protein [Herbinix sp.]